MPRIRKDQPAGRESATWQDTVIERLRTGKLVPILSNAIDGDLALGGYAAMVKAYADYSKIPLQNRSLAEVAQFKGITDQSIADALALKEDYVTFIKSRLYDQAEAAGVDADDLASVDARFDALDLAQMCELLHFPSYGAAGGPAVAAGGPAGAAQPNAADSHPLVLLASLDLPVYLTSSYHEFLEAVLRQAGKRPRTDFCRWHKNIESSERYPSVFDGSYEPTRQEPLVYHLHGLDRYEDSLVLTEDDYLTFLVACSQNIGKNSDPVHSRVRQALSDSSLLLLGYELQGWDFRSVFWGLVMQRTRTLTSVVSIQLEPSDLEKTYLDKYLDQFEFKVSWEKLDVYVATLAREVRRD